MYTVHVAFQVKEEFISTFREATLENAHNSIKEKGIARFDVEEPYTFQKFEAIHCPE